MASLVAVPVASSCDLPLGPFPQPPGTSAMDTSMGSLVAFPSCGLSSSQTCSFQGKEMLVSLKSWPETAPLFLLFIKACDRASSDSRGEKPAPSPSGISRILAASFEHHRASVYSSILSSLNLGPPTFDGRRPGDQSWIVGWLHFLKKDPG